MTNVKSPTMPLLGAGGHTIDRCISREMIESICVSKINDHPVLFLDPRHARELVGD